MSVESPKASYPKFTGPLSKIQFYILKVINIIDLPPFNWLVDTHIWRKQAKIGKVIAQTWRYRLASIGFILSSNERRLRKFKNKHKGERCFILGNGPSLNEIDLSLLKDEVTFGVNGIYLNEDKMGFAPTYYVVEDIFVAEDRAPEINAYHKPDAKFFGNYLHYCIEPDSKTLWLNIRANYKEYENFPFFSRNALRQVWVGGTVSYISMQLAYYMGFEEVYLVGFDHSYEIPEDVKTHKTEILSTSDDPNHFDPGYFGKGYRWHDPQVERMELSYYKAKINFERDGRVIKNATPGGKLEVFRRVDYTKLFHN